jgi:hypothetical protein
MPAQNFDAFLIYNEKESAIETIARELDARGVSTYFWRRDIPAFSVTVVIWT